MVTARWESLEGIPISPTQVVTGISEAWVAAIPTLRKLSWRLNDIGYSGPLSIEWEDGRMDRIHGATESCQFTRQLDFAPSDVVFDSGL